MKTCPYCSATVPSEAALCPACGNPLPEEMTHYENNHTHTRKKTHHKKVGLLSLVAVAVFIAGVFVYRACLPFSKNTAAIEKAESSVVKIYCYDHNGNESATGSGFFLYDDRTVITNYHVMENAYSCEISTSANNTFSVESILAYSKNCDLAILRLSRSTGLRPLEPGDSGAIKKGSPVTAIGSPLGIKNTVSQGILSGRITEGSMEVLQFTAAISSGSSGGALFDDTGNVIGITYASYADGQNLNLAIPIEKATELFSRKGTEQEPSAIYLKAHPHLPYLADYADALEVTLAQLQSDPYRYDGKIIKIHAFVSSLAQGGLRYITDLEHVSGNFDSDNSFYDNTDFETHPYIYTTGTKECKYEEKELTPGDAIVVIGKFVYLEKGDLLYTLGDKSFYTHASMARIEADLIYKDE